MSIGRWGDQVSWGHDRPERGVMSRTDILFLFLLIFFTRSGPYVIPSISGLNHMTRTALLFLHSFSLLSRDGLRCPIPWSIIWLIVAILSTRWLISYQSAVSLPFLAYSLLFTLLIPLCINTPCISPECLRFEHLICSLSDLHSGKQSFNILDLFALWLALSLGNPLHWVLITLACLGWLIGSY